jgi:hypothetical protein
VVRNSGNQTAYWEATVATAAPPTPNWNENMRIGSRTMLIAFPATTITAIAEVSSIRVHIFQVQKLVVLKINMILTWDLQYTSLPQRLTVVEELHSLVNHSHLNFVCYYQLKNEKNALDIINAKGPSCEPNALNFL